MYSCAVFFFRFRGLSAGKDSQIIIQNVSPLGAAPTDVENGDEGPSLTRFPKDGSPAGAHLGLQDMSEGLAFVAAPLFILRTPRMLGPVPGWVQEQCLILVFVGF